VTKIVWLKVDWRGTFNQVQRRIRQAQYNDSESSGFILQQVRDNEIIGKFVEKKVFGYELVDPFDKVTKHQETRYDYVKFKLSQNPNGLELISPPRSIKNFLGVLATFSEFRISVSNINIDVLKWFSSFQRLLPQVEIQSAICDDILLGTNVRGRLSLVGTNNLLEVAQAFKPLRWREISFAFSDIELGRGRCVLLDTGGCKIDIDRSPDAFFSMARKLMPAAEAVDKGNDL
jgi:hypothetical protein